MSEILGTERINWQVSQARFAYTQAALAVFSELPAMLDRSVYGRLLTKLSDRISAPKAVNEAYFASAMASWTMERHFSRRLPALRWTFASMQRGGISENIRRFTYGRTIFNTTREGVTTAAYLPSNVLGILSEHHYRVYGSPLFEDPQGLADIAASQAFSQLLHQMAYAPNGLWDHGRLSDNNLDKIFNPNPDSPLADNVVPEPSSPLRFSYDPSYAHAQLRKLNNTHASADVDEHQLLLHSEVIASAPSSGCPVRLATPSFKGRSAHYLAPTAAAFKTDAQTIQQTNPQTGIELGLACYRQALSETVDFLGRIGSAGAVLLSPAV